MLESLPVSMILFHFDNFLLRFYNLIMVRYIHLFILYVYVSIAI